MKRTGTIVGLAVLAAAMLPGTGRSQPGASGTAAFRFVNRSGEDIQVQASGGFDREFLVDDGDIVLQEVVPGSVTEIACWPPWGDGYRESQENPRRLTLRAPAAGMTNDVALALARKMPSTSGVANGIRKPGPSMNTTVPAQPAILVFHNPHDTPVSVVANGGLTGRFEVAPGATEERSAPAGMETSIRYHAPYSGLYVETADKPKSTKVQPVAGEKTMLELVLTPASPSGNLAMLRLANPNDAAVGILLSGGREDEIWLDPGKTTEVGIRPGGATMVRFYANDRQYVENSPDTAKTYKVAPKGGEPVSVDLKLAKRAYPVVQLVNGSSVALAVRVDGKTFTLSADESKTVQIPANRKVQLEWEAGEEGYLEGGREIGPYDWNQRERVTIVPSRRTPPSLRVRNVSRRAMAVTVTRSSEGTLVEEPFRLAGGSDRTVELPESGRYRLQTRAVPDKRNDADQNPDHYDATDQVVECSWGKTADVECTADLKRDVGNGSSGPDQMDWVRDALVSKLTAAKMRVDGVWGEHGSIGHIAAAQRALQDALSFARYVDVDEIAGDEVPYRAWAESVAAKCSFRNAEWQRIVEATEASGSWAEFFSRYPMNSREFRTGLQ